MKSLITALFLVLIPLTVQAQTIHGFVEVQSGHPDPHAQLTLDGGASIQFTEQWALSSFFLIKGKYAEGHVGPVWSPLPYLKLRVALGLQQRSGEMDLQTAYMLWAGYDRFSFTGAVEVGRTAYTGDVKNIWYDLTLRVKVLDWLTVGLKDRRPAGFGPVVEFSYQGLCAWFAWTPQAAEVAEFDPSKFIFGLKYGF